METNLSAEEQAQILQTIEMFEVITQSQPDDYQSFDILKEAYLKLGRQQEALSVARKLVTAYINMGLYSNALLECEGILRYEPDAADILALVGELDAKMNQAGQKTKPIPVSVPEPAIDLGEQAETIPLDPGDQTHTLIATVSTKGSKSPKTRDAATALEEDGNEAFVKFLSQYKMAPDDALQKALDKVRHVNRNLSGQALGASLLDELAKEAVVDLDVLTSNLISATQFAFVPLEYYDVDRQVVKMLPDNLTLGRLIVPFDLISRTIMVALCNPFDGPAKEAIQNQLDYNIQWYLARPAAIIKILRDVYRLDARD